MQIDNHALIRECKKGDKEALSLLYTRYASRMLALIQRYVDDLSDAQDILHDGFIIAFTRLDSLQNPDRVEYWLATIMRNLALKFLKSRDVAQIMDELPDVEDSEAVDNVLDFNLLLSLVDSLPAGYQNVFRLAVFENKSHKEISQILGIAPNSSSSQLFRAKLHLHHLIDSYKGRTGLLSLLLAASIPGVLYLLHPLPTETSHKTSYSSVNSSGEVQLPAQHKTGIPATGNTMLASTSTTSSGGSVANRKGKKTLGANRSSSAISRTGELTEENLPAKFQPSSRADNVEENSDSITHKSSTHHKDTPYEHLTDVYEPYPIVKKTDSDKWNFSVAISFGANNSGVLGSTGSSGSNNPGGSSSPNNPDYPGEYPDINVGIDGNDKDDDKDDKDDKGDKDNGNENQLPGSDDTRALKIPGNQQKSLKDMPHRNHLPLSFALTAQKKVTPWLGVETGLSYTYLHTTFEEGAYKAECYWHYVGIPLKLNLNLLTTSRLQIYGSMGGSVAFPVYSFTDYVVPSINSESFPSHPVWTVGTGIGVSFNIYKRMDLYFEPTLQYRFPNKYEVPNAWTDEPWGFTFPIGIRFKW